VLMASGRTPAASKVPARTTVARRRSVSPYPARHRRPLADLGRTAGVRTHAYERSEIFRLTEAFGMLELTSASGLVATARAH